MAKDYLDDEGVANLIIEVCRLTYRDLCHAYRMKRKGRTSYLSSENKRFNVAAVAGECEEFFRYLGYEVLIEKAYEEAFGKKKEGFGSASLSEIWKP